MTVLKSFHVAFVLLALGGFALRGYWMLTESRLLHHRLSRVLPHVNDTLLLATGLALAYGLKISPLAHPWLGAKLIALGAYILTGTLALKRGRTRRVRALALTAALAIFAYMLAVALSRSPLPGL